MDPHPLLLDALATQLRGAGIDVVATATTAPDAVALAERLQPDVAVVELELDGGAADGGLALLGRLRERAPDLRIVVFSAVDDFGIVDAAFDRGASSYILKTASSGDVVTAVRKALAAPPGHGVATWVRPAAAPNPAEGLPLTPREVEILQLVSEGHTNEAMARKLWVTEQTVKFHLSNIYRKLGVSNRTQASRWAQLHDVPPPSTSAA